MNNNSSQDKHIQKKDIAEELRESYLDYAMSVIVSRALPDVRDGLKPVQRRILYAMYEEGLRATAKFRKSATVVGTTLGRYHPHGDTAVYETLVRMAQDFSLRYPLIQGQGNFGSIDGDPPAAMRYTECRLTALAEEMLTDIEKDTVEFIPNYDGSRKEPRYLPAKLPQLLLNGTMGIAVGMATNIPPHNLKEVCSALIYLLNHPDASVEEIMEFIPGPDFPTGGIIFGAESIKDAYSTGKGNLLCRGRLKIEERGKHSQITITELPYQVNKAKLIASIAHLVEEKRITGIKNLRDESDKEGLRIVIELKSDAIPKRIINQLYRYTDLEKKFYVNFLALVENGLQPQVLSLKNLLQEYIKHRQDIITKRTTFLLKKAKERAHILEGLVKALNNIDAVIQTIKKSRNREEAEKKLIQRFDLDKIQANAILEMKLQRLAKLERNKIEQELKEKEKLIKDYNLILQNPKKILQIIKEELEYLRQKFGDERRTEIRAYLPEKISEEDLIPSQTTLITLSQKGYIKRMAPEAIRRQKRGGKGVISYEPRSEDDYITHLLSCNTRDDLLFFTDKGRVFRIKVYEINESSRTASGKTIKSYLSLSPGEKIISVINVPPQKSTTKQYLLLATTQGIIKKTNLQQYKNIRKGGIVAIRLNKNDAVVGAALTTGKDSIILVTASGLSIHFSEKEVRAMSRTATGVTGIKLTKDDRVISLIVIPQNITKAQILTVSTNGYGKRTSISEYRKQKRGGRGIKTAKITPKTGKLIKACLVGEEEKLIAVSQQGQILKIELRSIPLLKRSTQGVRIMKLNKGDSIAGFTLL